MRELIRSFVHSFGVAHGHAKSRKGIGENEQRIENAETCGNYS